MNSYPDFVGFFNNVAAKLLLLGQEEGKTHLLFVDSPETADLLLSAIRTKLTYPILLVEFYDEDASDTSGKFSELKAGFAVLDQAKKKHEGHEDVQRVIYEVAKPAAAQVLAYMTRMADRDGLIIDNKRVTMAPEKPGNWVGPFHNDLYGWRYEFTWRIAAAECFNPAHWKP
jgi:hypothetical protein